VITFKGLLKFLKDYLFEDFEPTFLPPDLDMTQMKTFLVKYKSLLILLFINCDLPIELNKIYANKRESSDFDSKDSACKCYLIERLD